MRDDARAASRAARAEAFVVLVPAPDFKSGGGRGDAPSAGSIPVRFRHARALRASKARDVRRVGTLQRDGAHVDDTRTHR